MKTGRYFSIVLLCTSLFLPGFTRADDTAIFGGGAIDVPANVLIIFDNSGSMKNDAPYSGEGYDPDKVYTGVYNTSKVYRSKSNWFTWLEFEDIGEDNEVDSDEIECWDARRNLNDNGHWTGRIGLDDPHKCFSWWDRSTYDYETWILRMGNYLNYLEANPDYENEINRSKLEVAKDVITELLETTSGSGVHFGLMVFNYEEGGRIIAPIQERDEAGIEDLVDDVNAITASTWTPLAETLAEAGLYFAGQESWANSGITTEGMSDTGQYKSPILYRCQKNYIILMTDGAPTHDKGDILTRDNYMHGVQIGDYDKDNEDPGSYDDSGTDYLDDVAKFLYDQDLIRGGVDACGVSFDADDFPHQNIITYTVGFDVDNTLLADTANETHGHGAYYTTAQGLRLADILERIMASILDTSVEFVAPMVPVNRSNRTYADNAMYLGLFLPDNSGMWLGNLKKFGLSEDGMLLDRYGNNAQNSSGAIMEGAKTCWYEVDGNEGIKVNVGGAGQVLLNQASRTFYTRNTGNALMAFHKDNANVTPTALGFADDTMTAQRDDLIDFIRAEGIYSPTASGDSIKPRTWVLGDILHSEPAVLFDDENSTNVIFVGANDGFLHCFLDNDHSGVDNPNDNLDDDTVTEAWAFAPWDLLPKLKNLPPERSTVHITGDSQHDYYVDGCPVIFKSTGTPKRSYVVFGLRRGGDKYYCLDVTNYNSPSFAWEISNNILVNETLGQSWSTPRFVKIKANSSDTTGKDVLLFAGGYDTNQDNADPGTGDSKGRAIYAIEPGSSSCTLNTNIKFHANNYSNLTYCIIDFNSFDSNDDGFEDTIYAGSLGGDLFVFSDRDGDGTWEGRRLFSAGNDGGTSGLRKFMKAPGVVRMTYTYDFVYIGSGNREDPTSETVTDGFYAIKNTWPTTWSDSTNTLTVDNLEPVHTDIFNSASTTADQIAEKEQLLDTKAGWWFSLPNLGEKVVSSPIVFDKAVWFTTFTPSPVTGEEEVQDKCSLPGGIGTARLYAVNYRTGSAMYDLDGDGDKERSIAIGGGIPSDPVIIVTKKGSYVGVGRQKGVFTEDSHSLDNFNKIYWIEDK